jgi:predicted DNA-binding protein
MDSLDCWNSKDWTSLPKPRFFVTPGALFLKRLYWSKQESGLGNTIVQTSPYHSGLSVISFFKFDRGGTMLSVPLPPEIEEKLAALAKSRGQSKSDFARQLIEESIEDLDDIETAVGRLENRQPALTSEQARKALGLDD